MYYQEEDIQAVKEQANILDVFAEYGIAVKKRGSLYECCCPIHSEKTPSCKINPAKGTWHCFGCGKGGNAIDFIMEYRHMNFIEALQELARIEHYELVEQQPDPKRSAIEQARRNQIHINALAQEFFKQQLRQSDTAMAYVTSRWTEEEIEHWDIGYAPANYTALWDYLTAKGVKIDLLLDSPLFKRDGDKKPYCIFYDRVMLPYHNSAKEPIAFCGRTMSAANKAKYINSPNDDDDANGTKRALRVFVKGENFYGWNFAKYPIRSENQAILVEGNPDVIRMHSIGCTNTVAACGTSLTKTQIAMLKAGCQSVLMIYDSDTAGQRAAVKNGRALLEAGIAPYVLTIPDDYNPATGEVKKQDPDTYFKTKEQFTGFSSENRQHFIPWYTRTMAAEKKDVDELSQLMLDVCGMMRDLTEPERLGYINTLASICGDKKMWMAASKQAKHDGQKVKKVNEGGLTAEQEKMLDEFGFYSENHCYYCYSSKDRGMMDVSNFDMTPLFHVASNIRSKRIYRITNFRGYYQDIEIPVKDMCSLAAFRGRVESLGNFLFYGQESHLNKIKAYLYDNTKTCTEITQLGWQPVPKFWAWSNGIVTTSGEWLPTDEYGCVKYGETWYYLPACSTTTEQDQDLYQFERRFVHQPSNADLLRWSDLFISTFGDNAVMAVCYYIASMFRDIIMERFRSFPILNIFGQPGSGKTKFTMSLLRLFGNAVEGPNVATGTIYAISEQMAAVHNGFVHLDEYKNNILPEKIELLKGAYENRGRSRRDMETGKVKQTSMNSGLILSGQEMTTADNALFSRIFYLTFDKSVFTPQERETFEMLKNYEDSNSLTPITNRIIPLRAKVEERYADAYHSTMAEFKQAIDMSRTTGRLVETYASVLAVIKALDGDLSLPRSYAEILPTFVSYLKRQDESVRNTSEVAAFWSGLETLLTNGDLEQGYDFIILRKSGVTCSKPIDNEMRQITYSQPMTILQLNPARAFAAYIKLKRQTSGKNQNILPPESLKYYLTTQEYYMGDRNVNFLLPIKNRQDPYYGRDGFGTPTPTAIRKTARAMCFNYERIQQDYGCEFETYSGTYTMGEETSQQ